MSIYQFRNRAGRLCQIPPKDLTDLEALYEADETAEEEHMSGGATRTVSEEVHERTVTYQRVHGIRDYRTAMQRVLAAAPALKAAYTGHPVVLPDEDPARPLGPGPVVVRYAEGSFEETDGAVLDRRIYGDRLLAFAREHQRRHPECADREAFEVAKRLNPEWARGYAAVGVSVEDHLRRFPPDREVIVEDGGVRFHLHNAGGYAKTEPAPSAEDLEEIQEEVFDEVRKVARAAGIPRYEAAERVLQGRKDVPAAIAKRIRDFYAPVAFE